jgi:hypothetical protein
MRKSILFSLLLTLAAALALEWYFRRQEHRDDTFHYSLELAGRALRYQMIHSKPAARVADLKLPEPLPEGVRYELVDDWSWKVWMTEQKGGKEKLVFHAPPRPLKWTARASRSAAGP